MADQGVTYIWQSVMEYADLTTLAWMLDCLAEAYCERYAQDCVAVRAYDMSTDSVVLEECKGLYPWEFKPEYFYETWNGMVEEA
jgi:hypothetical protein